MTPEHQAHTATTGIIGTIAPIIAVVASALPQIEQWLRIVSLIVGITVGLFTLYRLFKNKPNL